MLADALSQRLGAQHAMVVWGRDNMDEVSLGAGITASHIFAGGNTTCALTSDAFLTCWGRNNKGQIGNGTTQASSGVTPTAMTGVPSTFTVSDVEVGDQHVCAVVTGGAAVRCWGYDNKGQLGTVSDGNTDKSTATPTDSVGGTARSVSAGTQFTCVTLTDNSASCFGNNANGQLGRGSLTPTTASAPGTTSVVGAINKVVTGANHACALMTAGTVQCWGSSSVGQVGNGTSGANVLAPSSVSGLTGSVLDLAVGANHACAVIATGAVQCWGSNNLGQLGVNDQVDRSAAVTVSSLTVASTTTSSSSSSSSTSSSSTSSSSTSVVPTTAAVTAASVESTTTTSTTTSNPSPPFNPTPTPIHSNGATPMMTSAALPQKPAAAPPPRWTTPQRQEARCRSPAWTRGSGLLHPRTPRGPEAAAAASAPPRDRKSVV